MLFRITAWLLIIVSHVSLPVQAEDGHNAELPVILVLGDSLSAAYGIRREQSWVSLIGQRLEQKSFQYQVVNASISGDTTANGLNRIHALLAQYKPAIIIIELGGNDGLRGLSLKMMKRNLSRMIRISQQHQARVLLTGIRIPPNYGKQYTTAFYNTYPELATQYGVDLVPFLLSDVGDRSRLMQADGIHPTAEAQQIILDNVWPYLLAMIDRGD